MRLFLITRLFSTAGYISPVILWKKIVNLQLIATEGISMVLDLENYP